MRKLKLILIVLVAVFLVLGSYMVLIAPTQDSPAQPDHVLIYLIEATPTDFFLIPVERQIAQAPTPVVALQALLHGPLDHENLHESVPHSATLLDLTVHDGLASANFSSELVKDFPGGSLTEACLLEAIVNTLTEFPEIDRVQILVEGEIVESIGGHILITKPLRRSD